LTTFAYSRYVSYWQESIYMCVFYFDPHCKKTESHPAHKSVNVAWARTQSAWTLSTATCGRQYPSKSLWMSPLQATFHSPSLYMVLELSRMWIKQAICGQYWAILSLFRKDPVRISGGTKKKWNFSYSMKNGYAFKYTSDFSCWLNHVISNNCEWK